MRQHGKKNKCSVSHLLMFMGSNEIRLDGKEKEMLSHSLPVQGHGMECNEAGWSRKTNAAQFTYCWSWDEMQQDWMKNK
jgi:hypothetical protein